jgi:lipoprotein-releasing system permease protein
MSPLPFELQLALRYLRPKRTFVSVITLISVIGVTLGVAVLIIVISVMAGFDAELRDRMLGFNSHLQVSTYDNRDIKNHRELAQIISSNARVTAVAPYILQQAFVQKQVEHGEPSYAAQYVRGMDARLEGRVSVLPKSIVEGEFNLRGTRIMVGQAFARNLGLSVGDHLALLAPRDIGDYQKARKDDEADAPVPEDYEISGVFDLGYYEYNAAFIGMSLTSAQILYGMGEAVDGLYVMLDDPYAADAVRKELSELIGGDIFITTWLEQNSAMLEALVVEKNVMFYLLFFIMIVAAFGIVSAQITFVVQKTREIGMLKALGASKTQIMSVFLIQSLMVGVIGVLTGFGLGLLAVSYRNEFLTFLRKAFGFEIFPAKIYMFTELPALIKPNDIAFICGGSLFICLLAGLIPAINAARLHPIEALRHE